MLIGFSIDIISSVNKQLNIIEKSDKLNYLEELLIIKDYSVMDLIIIHLPYKEVERSKSCKLWVIAMIELFNVKIDGSVLEA